MTPPQEMPDGHYREIMARLEGLDGRMREIREDAREARDAATKLTERLGAQDIPAKLAELHGQMESGFTAARSDLVNAMSKITSETRADHADHEDRLLKLEAFRNRIEGAGGVFGWLAKNAPWLLSALLAGVAVLGFKDRIP